MKISCLTLGPVSTNTYFVENEDEVLIVDPAAEAEVIIQHIKEIDKPVAAILLTHAHFDHIGALDELMSYYEVEVYMHHEEVDFLDSPEKNGSLKFKEFGIPTVESQATPKLLDEGEHKISSFHFQVMHTPGHSPGSLTYVFKDFAIVGDTLFNNGIGRTDLYRGDYETLIDSIQDKLFTLNETMPLYPGHGPSTTVEDEQMNPFIFG